LRLKAPPKIGGTRQGKSVDSPPLPRSEFARFTDSKSGGLAMVGRIDIHIATAGDAIHIEGRI
jgi:hypothetical protein